MLIIAVIVAVSIRITKAKLDQVISYTYYSAYSTLSDVSRSMYLDIQDKKVDEEYLTFNIQSLKAIFTEKIAELKIFFNTNFTSPVYAYGAGAADVNNVYCSSEFVLDSSLCNQSINLNTVENIKPDSFASTCYNKRSTPTLQPIPNGFPGVNMSCDEPYPYRRIQACDYGLAFDLSSAPSDDAIANSLKNSDGYTCASQCDYGPNNSSACYRIGLSAQVCPGSGVFKCGWYNASNILTGSNGGGLWTCPEPADIGLHVAPEDEDKEYYHMVNRKTITGTCYYYAVRCHDAGFLFNDRCYTCENPPFNPMEQYKIDALMDKYCTEPEEPDGGGGEVDPNPPDPDPDEPEPDIPDPDVPDPDLCDKTSEGAPCGMILDAAACEYVADPDFSRDCPEGKSWNDAICGCENTIASLPKTGVKFCELFETYVNISGTFCDGDLIADNTTDFSGKKPDITLRNGIKLYNLSSSDAAAISELESIAGIDPSNMTDSVAKEYYEQAGYIVYADIDGKNGDSKLWEDVYPFYITLSGKVIPLFDKDNPGQSGADSKKHLEVSVSRRKFQQRGIVWILKSVPFQQAACTAGYVSQNAPYCKNYGLTIDNNCQTNVNPRYSPCKIKPIKPIGLFF